MDVTDSVAALKRRHQGGMREYRWVWPAYISYAACAIAAVFLLPLSDGLLFSFVILLTVIYVGALLGLAVRALKRVEERLDRMIVSE